MLEHEKENPKRDKQDAKELAAFLKDSRRETLLNHMLGIALSSYMNGVYDAYKSFKAAQSAV